MISIVLLPPALSVFKYSTNSTVNATLRPCVLLASVKRYRVLSVLAIDLNNQVPSSFSLLYQLDSKTKPASSVCVNSTASFAKLFLMASTINSFKSSSSSTWSNQTIEPELALSVRVDAAIGNTSEGARTSTSAPIGPS